MVGLRRSSKSRKRAQAPKTCGTKQDLLRGAEAMGTRCCTSTVGSLLGLYHGKQCASCNTAHIRRVAKTVRVRHDRLTRVQVTWAEVSWLSWKEEHVIHIVLLESCAAWTIIALHSLFTLGPASVQRPGISVLNMDVLSHYSDVI